MNRLKQILKWLERRLELRNSLGVIALHPVPASVATRKGWWYVFGSMAMTFFMLQVITGICLALVYEPTAQGAYASLEYLNYEAPLGWLLRAIHYWSASAMVVAVVIHMTQVFLMGAFKYPRELTWLVGIVLFGLTMALAFTGQVLRFDGDSYWGVGVGVAVTGRVPGGGPPLVHLLLGGAYFGTQTLSRFFTLHAFVLPGALMACLTLHLYLVVKRGISEPPRPGHPVNPATYDADYRALLNRGVSFFPHVIYRDAVACAIGVLIVVGLAVTFGPKGPGQIADPTLIHAEPRPDWYFLPLFALAALAPPSMEVILMLGLPVIGLLVLAAVPFVAGKGERSVRRRPVAVLVVLIAFVSLTILGWYGATSPWSPQIDAWSAEPVPPKIVTQLTPLELQGAIVFQNKCCRNCHALDGTGGQRGPDLTSVGTRLNFEAMVRQVVQGGGNMPAYGKQLNSAEVEALVTLLVSLRPAGQPPSRMPAAPVQPSHAP
ncbi:MAG: cytochrome b N-terminal domain-containing protein [Planctomycetales bacterium]|nr:cytochrome b N-terminal domain-containing protein [Planctomycetales bacterium]